MKRGLRDKRIRREFRQHNGVDMATWLNRRIEDALMPMLFNTEAIMQAQYSILPSPIKMVSAIIEIGDLT